MVDLGRFHLVASTPTLDAEPRARETADLLEFRMDMAEDPLDALAAYDGELELLVTNRPDWEGGERSEGVGRREELLEALSVPSVAAVDLELRALEYPAANVDLSPVAEAAADSDVPVIVSMHDFNRTPPRDSLVDYVHRGCQHGQLAKLATTPEKLDDVLGLLQVTADVTREGRTVASMAMGDMGAHSRAIAPLYGSKLTYAPVDPADATAPGQFDLETLATLLDAFSVPDGGI